MLFRHDPGVYTKLRIPETATALWKFQMFLRRNPLKILLPLKQKTSTKDYLDRIEFEGWNWQRYCQKYIAKKRRVDS